MRCLSWAFGIAVLILLSQICGAEVLFRDDFNDLAWTNKNWTYGGRDTSECIQAFPPNSVEQGVLSLGGTNRPRCGCNFWAICGEATWAHYTIEARVKTTYNEAGAKIGIVWRFPEASSEGDFYAFTIAASNEKATIEEVHGWTCNARVSLGTAGFEWQSYSWYDFRIEVNRGSREASDSVHCYIDGVLIVACEIASPVSLNGKVGIYAEGQTLLGCDYFRVTLPEAHVWEPVYCEDFSSAPQGWVISDSSYYHWNPSDKCFYIHIPTSEEAPEFPYAYHEIDYHGGSFKIEFDMYVIEQGWNTALWCGLINTPCDTTLLGAGRSCVGVLYGASDRGKHITLIARDAQEFTVYEARYEFGSSEGKLLHHVITYLEDERTLSFAITQAGTSYLAKAFGGVGPFSPGMDCLAFHDRFRPSYSYESAVGCLSHFCFYQEHHPLGVSDNDVTFPATTVGDSTSRILALTNAGETDLVLTDLGAPSGAFCLTPGFLDSIDKHILIPRRSRVNMEVRFVPTGAGNHAGRMEVHTDDPVFPVTSIALHGIARALEFTTAELYSSGEVNQGDALRVLCVVADSVRVDSAIVNYRAGGKQSYSSFKMDQLGAPVNDQYSLQIPAGFVTPAGIEYFVTIFNGRFSVSGPVSRLRVRVKNLTFPHSQMRGVYGMISIPLDMGGDIVDVLEDDLGWPDPAVWRMFAYSGREATYIEVPNETLFSFEQGKSYWLAAASAVQLDIERGQGLSAPTDGFYSVALEPGWNMIADPFDFTVAWDSILVDSLRMMEQDVVEAPFHWNPQISGYEDGVAVLHPFDGYWVKNLSDSDVVLRVPPREAEPGVATIPSASATPGGSTGADLGATRVFTSARGAKAVSGISTREGAPLATDSWEIGIRASSCGVVDLCNFVGVRRDASTDWDKHDRSEPPMSPGRAISLYFPHSSWERHAGTYAADMRGEYVMPKDPGPAGRVVTGVGASDGETLRHTLGGALGDMWGHTWRFDVAKSFADVGVGDELVLQFVGMESVPAGAAVYLVDEHLGRLLNLREVNRYCFYSGMREVVPEDESRFVLLVGNGEYIGTHGNDIPALPTQTMLHQNYPNPFTASTIVRYDVASASCVRLKIFDASGALVRLLHEGRQEPGRYEMAWDGENDRGRRVAAGIYFCQMETSAGVAGTRKMLLLK